MADSPLLTTLREAHKEWCVDYQSRGAVGCRYSVEECPNLGKALAPAIAQVEALEAAAIDFRQAGRLGATMAEQAWLAAAAELRQILEMPDARI